MTLRLDDVHERMLERLQSRHPGISRQKLFEHLLEQSVTEDEEHIEDVGRRILHSNPDLWKRLRAR